MTWPRLTREVWRLNKTLGFTGRMGYDPSAMGRLAKAVGATEAQVSAWMGTPGERAWCRSGSSGTLTWRDAEGI